MNRFIDKGRNEIKYFIHPDIIPDILEKAKPHVHLDKFARNMPDNRYIVRSLYYDSPSFDFYWEKLDGLKVRRKLRIRVYNEQEADSAAFLEIKRRFENTIVKERAGYSFDEIKKMMENPKDLWIDYQASQNGSLVLGKWLDNIIRFQLQPTVLVVYNREAYVGRIEDDRDVRLTIDYDIRSKIVTSLKHIYDDHDLSPVLDNLCVLELKFNYFMPKWMRSLVAALPMQQQSISKYCMGVDETFSLN